MLSIFSKFLFVLFSISSFAFSVQHFELPWMNNTSENSIYQTQKHPGAVWVLETFFLGCPYCNDNAPQVNSLANHFKNDERVQVLDIGIDSSASSYAEWIRRHQPNHPVLNDSKRVVVRQLGTTSYPSTYVLDKNLKVIYKSAGVWSSKVEAQIKEAVERALEAQKDLE